MKQWYEPRRRSIEEIKNDDNDHNDHDQMQFALDQSVHTNLVKNQNEQLPQIESTTT